MDMRKLRAMANQKAEDMKGEGGGDYAPWLTLDEGEEFVGRITVIRDNSFDDSGKTHLYEATSLEDADSTFTLPAHQACVSKMAKFKPEIGQVVYIKYLGKVKSTKSKFRYNDYEVAVLTEEDLEELGIAGTSETKPAKKTSKKPVDDDDDDDEPVKKPAKKTSKKPVEDDDEDEDEKPSTKKPAKKADKQGAFPDMDEEEKKSLVSYIKKALEFNDNEIDLGELMRLCKTKGIVFDDETDAKKKILYCGFDVNEDGIVSKA